MQPDDAVGTDAGAKAGDEVVRSDERTLALVAHLIGAFAGCIGPIIIFAIKREDSRFVAFHAIQAFLWHVALVAAWIGSFVVFGLSMSAVVPHMPHAPPGSPAVISAVDALRMPRHGEALAFQIRIDPRERGNYPDSLHWVDLNLDADE